MFVGEMMVVNEVREFIMGLTDSFKGVGAVAVARGDDVEALPPASDAETWTF